MYFLAAGQTDRGRCRPGNEDSIWVGTRPPLFMVADGMGGHAAGEVASRMAVETIGRRLQQSAREGAEPLRLLQEAVLAANGALCAAAEGNPAWQGMGTTLAAIFPFGSHLAVAHVGDSRVYRLRGRQIEQLTEDHTVVAEQVRLGLLSSEEAAHASHQHLITRALGQGPDLEVSVQQIELRDGDRYLLCSDGLSSLVPDEIIAGVIHSLPQPRAACRALVDLANQRGGTDNISVVLVEVFASLWGFGLARSLGIIRR